MQPTYKPQQPIPKPPVQDEFSTPPSPDTPINVVDDEDEDAGSSSEDKQRRTDAASLNFWLKFALRASQNPLSSILFLWLVNHI